MVLSEEITAVRDSHKFDVNALAKYLQTHVADFGTLEDVQQFQGGQSNPTFLLQTTRGNFVLRKKPPGELLASAHQIEREYLIMKALQETEVPVPKVHLLCADASVIGTPFYVMDCVEGRIFRDPKLPNVEPEERKLIYQALADSLARLHRLDWQNLGLADFGKQENFLRRQVKRWSSQYEAAADVQAVDASQRNESLTMKSLGAWLDENIPPGDERGKSVSIVHGDYRLENLILHPHKPEVLAIIDWELSTLGHPLSDLGYCCISYHLPSTIDELPGLQGIDFETIGIPSEAQFLRNYFATGSGGIEHHSYFVAFSFFRLAAIAQGIMKRATQGTASSAKAERVGKLAKMFAEVGWQTAMGKQQ